MKCLVIRSHGALFGTLLVGAACALFGTVRAQTRATQPVPDDIQHGRYLVQIGGCNDCHTAGYTNAHGKVDEQLWLTGDSLGWRGPWGTTYPPNLRRLVTTLSEDQWVTYARREMRPPMPWYNLRDMSERDVRAIYRYIKHLGSAGEPAPTYLSLGQEPRPPFFQLFPTPPE
jgi:mono/diheme cytochrome c family protein